MEAGFIPTLGAAQWIVLLVGLQRFAELLLAYRNTLALLADGAVEHGARHYPWFPILHIGWLMALFILVPIGQPVSLPWMALFLLLQAGRVWVIVTLGRFWTTRILTLPGERLVRTGPFRFVRHPNYLVVAGEIAVLPLAFGAWPLALLFSLLNGLLLWHRIRIEDAALAPRREV